MDDPSQPRPSPDPAPPAPSPRPRVLRLAGRGARLGAVLACVLAVPVAFVGLTLGLALLGFGVGGGVGVALPYLVVGSFLFALSLVLLSALTGALFGLVGGLVFRMLPRRASAGLWSWLDRPIVRGQGRPAPGPNRRRRWLWVLGASAPVILVLSAGLGFAAGRAVERRALDAIAAADRDDPDWRIDDLMASREEVPDEENSALVVAEVFELLPEGWPGPPPPPPGVPRPAPTEREQAYDRLAALPDNVRMDDPTFAILAAELESHAEAVQLARSVADFERGRHELELGPALIDTPLPETQAARTPARLLMVDAALRVHDGDPDGAIESCRAILGVARSIGDEPFLISQLVRVAIGGMAIRATQRVLGQGEPSDAALDRLQRDLLDEMARPLLLHGMRGERATLVELIRRLGTGELPISALGRNAAAAQGTTPQSTGPGAQIWYDHQMAIGLEWMNQAVRIARRPVAERGPLWESWDDEIDRVKRRWYLRYPAVIPLLMTPATSAADAAHSRHHCELATAAILLAAERQRRKTGDWPASVAAIGPEFLPEAPLDPYSLRTFLVERRDGRFLVHSVGPNGRDEHGDYDPRRMTHGGPDDIGGGAWDVPLRRQMPPVVAP